MYELNVGWVTLKIQVSESPWPVWHVLAVFADMNKGQWYWGGDRKYFRTYGDWNLRRDELSPLVDPSLDFLSEAWKAEVASRVTALQSMPPAAYVEAAGWLVVDPCAPRPCSPGREAARHQAR